MFEYNNMLDLVFENIKKFFYPEEWIEIDLALSKSEIFTLLLVDRHGEIIMSQMADYISVPMSTATGIVDRLVKNCYLKRERSETDRRIVVIRITDKGKKTVEKMKNSIFKHIQLIYETLTDDERQLLYNVFMKIVNVLDSKTEKEGMSETKRNGIQKIDIE